MKFIAQKPESEDVVLKEGQRFQNRHGHEYILATVACKTYALINLETGNRWWDGTSLSKVAQKMTEENAQTISEGWILVHEPKED